MIIDLILLIIMGICIYAVTV